MAGTDHRPHMQHKEGDTCPVCHRPWEEWPIAHKADLVCGQRCEKSEQGQRLIAYELHQADIAAPIVAVSKCDGCDIELVWNGTEYEHKEPSKCSHFAQPASKNAAGTVW